MENTAPQTPRPPDPKMLADFIKVQRWMIGWKQDILAAKAGVSLSTLQRAERGEAIRPASLDRLGVALGHPPGAFTTPRVPLPPDQAEKAFSEHTAWLKGTVPVTVAPLRHQTQLRQLGEAHMMVFDSDLDDEAKRDIEELREWLDLLSFMRAQDGDFMPIRDRRFGLRRLYADVLACVGRIERQHKAVCLIGAYNPKTNMQAFPTIRLGIVALRSREHNPAAGNITRLLAAEMIDAAAAFQAWQKEE